MQRVHECVCQLWSIVLIASLQEKRADKEIVVRQLRWFCQSGLSSDVLRRKWIYIPLLQTDLSEI